MEKICSECALRIDLRTTYLCVSVFRNGAIKIITNQINERITPSIVTFLDNYESKTGEETLNFEIKNPKNTVYSIKKLMRRTFDKKCLKK